MCRFLLSLALIVSFSSCTVGSSSHEPEIFKTNSERVGDLPPINRKQLRALVGPLFWPVAEGVISSRFGLRAGNFHEGIDIRAPRGSPVYAAHSGVVVYADDSWASYGNMIVIKKGEFFTVYGHNDNNHVREGDTVERGEHIADVGMTGDATGPHLHFELRIERNRSLITAVDPLSVTYLGVPKAALGR
jgi:lipoprotein NlpD